MNEDPTPSFLITTDDVLSEVDVDQLRNDIQITARPEAAESQASAARQEWPGPPLDGTFDDIKRYAFVRASADYFLAFDEAAPLPAGFGLSPAEAWALAEETYERTLQT